MVEPVRVARSTMIMLLVWLACIGGSGALDNGLGATPALGWSSWNFFTYDVNETIALQIGEALVSTGLRDAGYTYVNIDAGSLQRTRGPNGKLAPDPAKFPRGFRYLSDRLHRMGLRFGVYTDISDGSCGTGPGSKGHYAADAATFAHDWQIDYLKVDYCGPWDGTATALGDSCAAGQMCMAGQPDLRRAHLAVPDAITWCDGNPVCAGFTINRSDAVACTAPGNSSQAHDVHFQRVGCSRGHPYDPPAAGWSTWSKPGTSWVSYQPQPQYVAWKALGDALNRTGRPIYYAICPHVPTPGSGAGKEFSGAGQLSYAPPPEWSAAQRHTLANSILVEYVNTADHWYAPKVSPACRWVNGSHFTHECHGGIITNIDAMVQMTRLDYSAPGSWNDADMLQLCTFGEGRTELGGTGMTMAEYRAHYSVWAVLASPLILSADLRTIKEKHPECLKLMLNHELIAVNQDPTGLPPRLVSQTTNMTAARRAAGVEPTSSEITTQVFARPMHDGALAVVLLNRGEAPAKLTVGWRELGLDVGQRVAVRDVGNRRSLPDAVGQFGCSVGKHEVTFVRFSPARSKDP